MIFFRTSIPFTSYAKHRSTANNAKVVGKDAIVQNLNLQFLINHFSKKKNRLIFL